jgi:hypothetical protein
MSQTLPKVFAFVDVETTGTSPIRDRVIDIGILRVEDGKIVSTYNQLINPQTRIPPEIQVMTGIHETELEMAPTFSTVAKDIRSLLDGALFVAHNARFDYGFLKQEFEGHGYTEGVDLFTFPYDWRLGVSSENLNKLRNTIDQILLESGASGPVTIYANNVLLAGDFFGDVHIFALGHVTLAPETHIHGQLSYEAPETVTVPDTVAIDGGVIYSSISYLPDAGTSRTLAFLSIGLFLIARIIGALLLAGLLAGLFPRFAEKMVARVFRNRARDLLLTLLLGFAALVATPAVVLLLLITFVGGGLALLIGVLYTLVLLLSVTYAGILIGGVLSRRFRGRQTVVWHDGVIGMVLLSLGALVPSVGLPFAFLCVLYTLGALLQTTFHFAFPRDGGY